MLPPEVDTLIRESIDVYLKAQGYRPPRFRQSLLAQSFAGETIQPAKVAAVTGKEIETVSVSLVTAIKNVVERVQIDPDGALEKDLIQHFDLEFDKVADAIQKFGVDTFEKLSATASPSSWLADRLNDARQARHLELSLLALAISKSRQSETGRFLYNSDNERVGIVDSDT